jgi:hypothetical protein
MVKVLTVALKPTAVSSHASTAPRGGGLASFIRRRMADHSAASFLNLDVEIEAKFDLSPLAEYLGGRVFVLYCGATDVGFKLSVEPDIEGLLSPDPVACTEHMLQLLENMPSTLHGIWAESALRVFDYGFDGGLESPPTSVGLSSQVLARLVKLEADIRLTIYPFRDSQAEEV